MEALLSKRLTVKEIAARAGVSVGTVSHVLNNPQKVRLERRRASWRAV
jgi:DNA-binding LacI/PurR family transcriptional regulator